MSEIDGYQDYDLMLVIIDKGGLIPFLAELADTCEKHAEGDVVSMPDSDIGRCSRQIWLTAAAGLLELQEKLDRIIA